MPVCYFCNHTKEGEMKDSLNNCIDITMVTVTVVIISYFIHLPLSLPPLLLLLLPLQAMTYECPGWHSGRPETVQPPLDYIAPESLLKMELHTASDIYSLAVLLHAIYNHGKPVYQSHNSLASCKQHASEVSKKH